MEKTKFKTMEEIKKELTAYYMTELEKCLELGVEEGHGYADTLLCELLNILGYVEVANRFQNLKKWYS